MSTNHHHAWPRRSLLARFGGALALGAAAGAVEVKAQSGGSFTPQRHDIDSWMETPSKHRLFLDTTTARGVATAIFYSNNFLNASSSAYGLADSDSSVIVGVRAESVGFAFNDLMWAKYSAAMSEMAAITDPLSNQPARVNLLTSPAHKTWINRGVTLEAVAQRGLRLSVCQLATRGLAGAIAGRVGGAAEDIYKELVAHTVASAHMVPAGIVALSRAQERGYTFSYVA